MVRGITERREDEAVEKPWSGDSVRWKSNDVMRIVVLAVALLGGVALLAGCSSSPAKNALPKSTTTTTRVPTTTTTITSNPSSTTSPTVSATPASDQCTADDLQPSWPGTGNGASGNLFYVVNLRNASGATCVTGGYVGVSAYDPAGDLIAASASRGPLMGSNPPLTLSIAPGSSMHFIVGLPDVDEAAGGTECSTTVGALHLIPPNEKTELQIATPISTGYPRLCGSTFLVGPLQSGTINS